MVMEHSRFFREIRALLGSLLARTENLRVSVLLEEALLKIEMAQYILEKDGKD